jgi:regulator of protease activity HflC (stomatin/prohibitin superfamily)
MPNQNNTGTNDTNPDDMRPEFIQPQGDPAPPSPSVRGPSVRLREGGQTTAGGVSLRMDPANQSLADALRFTYGLLKFSMIVLVALFAFSGIKTINEGERGIRVFLGQPQSLNLNPGFHLGFPYPIGEMIRVGAGTAEVALGLAFMPEGGGNDDQALAVAINRFSTATKLQPDRSYSNITADLNIAHTQWTVNYRRTDHRQYAENILPEQETAIIRLATQRGVVLTLAGLTIDELLKQTGESAAAARVREIAQRTLDELNSGITIDRVTLIRKIPPAFLLERFASVQSAAQNAGRAREDSLLNRDRRLNEVAGAAAVPLTGHINEYERLIELGETDAAAALLTQIDAILDGRPAQIDDQIYAAGLVSGEVAELLERTRSRASSRVSQAIADRDLFNAKLIQYESNPRLMIARDWSAAMAEFLAKPFVQTMILPEGSTTAELLINEDPAIVRELDRERKRQEAQRASEERFEMFQRDLFRSQRGIQETEE